ncbi:unnamed protein product [Sphagnum balticum]
MSFSPMSSTKSPEAQFDHMLQFLLDLKLPPPCRKSLIKDFPLRNFSPQTPTSPRIRITLSQAPRDATPSSSSSSPAKQLRSFLSRVRDQELVRFRKTHYVC